MADKIYVGSGKEGKYEGCINITLCLEDFMAHRMEYMNEYNGKHYIKLNVVKKRETDQYGKTHYVAIDTWEPGQKEEKKEEAFTDSIPF